MAWRFERESVCDTRSGEAWHEDCLVPRFENEHPVIISGGILGAGGKKIIVASDKEDWGTIAAKTYVDHILTSAIWSFWSGAGGCWWASIMAYGGRGVGTPGRVDTRISRSISNSFPYSHHKLPTSIQFKIYGTWLTDGNPRPKGRVEVRAAVLYECDRINEEDIQKFVDSMPERIQAVLAANGGHTR